MDRQVEMETIRKEQVKFNELWEVNNKIKMKRKEQNDNDIRLQNETWNLNEKEKNKSENDQKIKEIEMKFALDMLKGKILRNHV